MRAGLAYDEGPVPDDQHRTARIPDGSRTWVAFGAGYQLSKNTAIDFGYAHLFVPDVKIDNTTEGTLSHTLTGEYDPEVDIVSLQLRGSF